jgi:hypothetical protein
VVVSLLVLATMCGMVVSHEDCPANMTATLCNAATGFVVEGEINFNEPRFVFYTNSKDQYYIEFREMRESKVEQEEKPQVFKEEGDSKIKFDDDEAQVDFINVPIMEDLGFERRMIYLANVNFTDSDNENNFTAIRINATLPKDKENDEDGNPNSGVLALLTIELFDYFWKQDGGDARLTFEFELANEDGDEELNRDADNTYISASFEAQVTNWDAYYVDSDGAEHEVEVDTWLIAESKKFKSLLTRPDAGDQPVIVFRAQFGMGDAASLQCVSIFVLLVIAILSIVF